MKHVILQRLQRYLIELRQTVTYEPGSKNTLHESINQALGTRSYSCPPYHSWEKGSIEHVNGLIRRPFQKKARNFWP